MATNEMISLKNEYGDQMKISKAYHLHDEDDRNEWIITYNGIIVGSELVSTDFVRNYIKEHFA